MKKQNSSLAFFSLFIIFIFFIFYFINNKSKKEFFSKNQQLGWDNYKDEYNTFKTLKNGEILQNECLLESMANYNIPPKENIPKNDCPIIDGVQTIPDESGLTTASDISENCFVYPLNPYLRPMGVQLNCKCKFPSNNQSKYPGVCATCYNKN
jgi:hypothetical protein